MGAGRRKEYIVHSENRDFCEEFESLNSIVGSDVFDYYVLGDLNSIGIFTRGSIIERYRKNKDSEKDSYFNLVSDRALNYVNASHEVNCVFPFALSRQGCLMLANNYLHRELLKSVASTLTSNIEFMLQSNVMRYGYNNNRFNVKDLSTVATEFYSKHHYFNVVFNPRDWQVIKDLGNVNPVFNLSLISDSYCDTGLRLLPDWNWRQGSLLFGGRHSISIAGDTSVIVQRGGTSTYEMSYTVDINLVDNDALSIVGV